MRTALSPLLPALAAVLLLGACAHNPEPAAPSPQVMPAAPAQPSAAPAPAPAAAPAEADLTGDWNFEADFPDQRMVGVIQLRRSGSSYVGTATPADAEGSATLTSLTTSGNHVEMVFDTPDGEARAEAVLADPKTMNGTVTYAGSTGPFTARKQ
jgi:hypothetical protein